MRNKEKEPLRQRLNRKACNTWILITGMVEKSETQVKIKLKEHEINERKKKFGVVYMDLLNSSRSEQELQQYMQQSKSDVAVLSQEVAFLQNKVTQIDKETHAKLCRMNRQQTTHSSPQTGVDTTPKCADTSTVLNQAQFPIILKDPPVAPPINPFDNVDEPAYVKTDTALLPTAPVQKET